MSQCGLGGFPHEQLANPLGSWGSPKWRSQCGLGVSPSRATGVNWRGLGGSMLVDVSHNFLETVLSVGARRPSAPDALSQVH